MVIWGLKSNIIKTKNSICSTKYLGAKKISELGLDP